MGVVLFYTTLMLDFLYDEFVYGLHEPKPEDNKRFETLFNCWPNCHFDSELRFNTLN